MPDVTTVVVPLLLIAYALFAGRKWGHYKGFKKGYERCQEEFKRLHDQGRIDALDWEKVGTRRQEVR